MAALISIIITHFFVLSRHTFFPYPELFIYPYLTNLGLVPYAQILDQHFPGLMFLPVNLANIGFNTPESFFILHLAIIAITHLLIYKISKNYFANIFYLLWQPYFEGNTLWIDSFIPLLLLPAFYTFTRKKYLSSAIFVGLTLAMKQVILPLILLLIIYIYFVEENRKLAVKFLVISAIPMGLVSLYFLNLGIFNDFFYWTVTFNLTIFKEMGRKYATFNELIKISYVFLPAFLYIFLNFKKQKNAFLLGLFTLGSLIFAYARFDLVHLQPVLPFIVIGTALLIEKLPFKNYLIIFYILISLYPVLNYTAKITGDDIVFFGSQEELLTEEVRKYTDEGEPILALATTPHIYYLTKTRPSGNIFVFNFPWFLVEAEKRIAGEVIIDPPKVVIRDKTATTSSMNLYEYMPNLDEFVEQNYTLDSKIGNIEVLLPNDAKDSN